MIEQREGGYIMSESNSGFSKPAGDHTRDVVEALAARFTRRWGKVRLIDENGDNVAEAAALGAWLAPAVVAAIHAAIDADHWKAQAEQTYEPAIRAAVAALRGGAG